MTCTNCGRTVGSDKHVLQFVRETGSRKELELELCNQCLAEMLSEQWISRSREPSQ